MCKAICPSFFKGGHKNMVRMLDTENCQRPLFVYSVFSHSMQTNKFLHQHQLNSLTQHTCMPTLVEDTRCPLSMVHTCICPSSLADTQYSLPAKQPIPTKFPWWMSFSCFSDSGVPASYRWREPYIARYQHCQSMNGIFLQHILKISFLISFVFVKVIVRIKAKVKITGLGD